MAFNPVSYVKESIAELEKVVWPTKQETLKLTIVVLLVSLAVGAYIAGLDTVFTLLVERFLNTE